MTSAAPHAVIYNGFDEMFVGGMAMGADGAIGTTYNFMGDLFVAMYAAMRGGDLARARALQTRANAAIDVLVDVGVFPGTKAALACMGLDVGPCRRPFAALTEAQHVRVRAMVEALRAAV